MRKKITLMLRKPFSSLESICSVLNNMLLLGKGNHVKVDLKSEKKEQNDDLFICVKLFRCKSYASIEMNRDVIDAYIDDEPVYFETVKKELKSIDYEKNLIAFSSDFKGNFLNIMVLDSYNEACNIFETIYKDFANLSEQLLLSGKVLQCVNLCLRKPFTELPVLIGIINKMFDEKAGSHIMIKDNFFEFAFMYDDVNRASLIVRAGFIRRKFEKHDSKFLSCYNWACSNTPNPYRVRILLSEPKDDKHGPILNICIYEPTNKKLLAKTLKMFETL